MEIFLDIARSDAGRLTGTAQLGPDEAGIAFSGTLELVAVLERLLEAEAEAEAEADVGEKIQR